MMVMGQVVFPEAQVSPLGRPSPFKPLKVMLQCCVRLNVASAVRQVAHVGWYSIPCQASCQGTWR